MQDTPHNRRSAYFSSVLLALVLATTPVFLAAQSTTERTPELGTIAGHVSVPEEASIVGPLKVLLMSPRWTNIWNADLQKRTDAYFERYRAAFVENPEFFNEVSMMAQRDSIIFTISRLQQELGPELDDIVKEADEDGRFEFTDVALGQYMVVVIGQQEQGSMLLSESLEVRGPLPQFIEIRNRIQ